MYKFLQSNKEYVLSKQILRSGTSIAANIQEALSAESTADFIHKLSVALKENRETFFWIEQLEAADYLFPKLAESLKADNDELNRLLFCAIRTSKAKKIVKAIPVSPDT